MRGVIQDGQQVGVQSYTSGLELTLFDNPPRLPRHLTGTLSRSSKLRCVAGAQQ
jgi:hypothetical protein